MVLKRFMSDVCGATAMEYGLLTSLISVFVMVALMAVGVSIDGNFTTIEKEFVKVSAAP